MKERQAVMWDGERPRAERRQASAEAWAIHDVALEQARRAQGALADVAQGRRSVGEGLRELFEAVNPIPIAQAFEAVRPDRDEPSPYTGFPAVTVTLAAAPRRFSASGMAS